MSALDNKFPNDVDMPHINFNNGDGPLTNRTLLWACGFLPNNAGSPVPLSGTPTAQQVWALNGPGTAYHPVSVVNSVDIENAGSGNHLVVNAGSTSPWNIASIADDGDFSIDITSDFLNETYTFTAKYGSNIWNANKFQNVNVSSTSPTNGQAWIYNSTSSQWEPTSIGGGSTVVNSDGGGTVQLVEMDGTNPAVIKDFDSGNGINVTDDGHVVTPSIDTTLVVTGNVGLSSTGFIPFVDSGGQLNMIFDTALTYDGTYFYSPNSQINGNLFFSNTSQPGVNLQVLTQTQINSLPHLGGGLVVNGTTGYLNFYNGGWQSTLTDIENSTAGFVSLVTNPGQSNPYIANLTSSDSSVTLSFFEVTDATNAYVDFQVPLLDFENAGSATNPILSNPGMPTSTGLTTYTFLGLSTQTSNYVSFSSDANNVNINVSGVEGVLATTATIKNISASTSTTDLNSFIVAANTVGDGQKLRYHCAGNYTAITGNLTLKCDFGGLTIFTIPSTGLLGNSSSSWICDFWVTHTSGTNTFFEVEIKFSDATSLITNSFRWCAASTGTGFDFTSSNVIKMTVATGTSTTLVQNGATLYLE